MQPDDLSIPRGDSKIKLKLNLHVKKRLQETKKTSQSSLELSSPPVAVSRGASQPTVSKTKKLKTKHSQSSPSVSVCTTVAGTSSGSASKHSTELLLSPGTIGGNSNDATNSSFNSADFDPDAGVSNDGQERADKNVTRTAKPDIFTLILNEKKSSLMRDPEVITFLREMMEKRNK
ncbi:uncharacterized protein LOC129731835 [Wyeomyia smithii]|uniref:uncharacterized protein LOC129731835 n=1 Tax=Wyeomyia smithii TaxID=174621 RepID=UPI0024682018|nr:uncharacterized protein LOC129731835 [Wyeomyia smithii]